MAAVGAEVTSSWFLSSGVISFFVLLLLLSIFLTSLCSDCGRRSFELQDSSVEKNPSALIKVVKLEDAMMARENPIINEIQNDEKEIKTEEEIPVQFPPWRSHLTGPQRHGVNGCAAQDSDHIYHTIGEERAAGAGADADASTPAANHEPRSAAAADNVSTGNTTSVYAQVSKVANATPTATIRTPAQVQEEEEEEEEETPPLPDRLTEMMEG